jgi:hypothetical protein
LIRPLLLLSLFSCATVQKIETGTVNCAEASIAQNIAPVVVQAVGALTGSNSGAALDQLLEADGLDLAFCAVQAAVSALENGGAVAPLSLAIKQGAVATPQENVIAIARGEAWLAAHRR